MVERWETECFKTVNNHKRKKKKLGNCSGLKDLRHENQMQYVILDCILYWKRKKNAVKDITDSIDIIRKQMVFWIKVLYF